MSEKECRTGGETAHRMGVGSSMRYTIRTIWNADKGCILLSFYKNCTEEVYMSFFFILMLQMIYSYIENGKPFMGLLLFCGSVLYGTYLYSSGIGMACVLYPQEDTESICVHIQ